jgi:chemotaxis protein MotA
MTVIVGSVVVVVCVVGGYLLHGGAVGVLFQWNEFLIIGGAAAGSLLVGSPLPVLRQMAGRMRALLKGDPFTQPVYVELLGTLYHVFVTAKRDGLISLEPHVDDPAASSIFSSNAFLLEHRHALDYLCDTLKLLLTGSVPPHDLEALLDIDLETHHRSSSVSAGLLQKLGDALPGLGIVAAVLGIVITMQAIDGPAAEIGHKVAAALVGTFLGVLMSYGFVSPMAAHLGLLAASESRYLECIRAGLLAFAKGTPPIVAVEYARRAISGDVRPTFEQAETAVRSDKLPKAA